MGKHKSQRALYELLAKHRGQAKGKPDVGPEATPSSDAAEERPSWVRKALERREIEETTPPPGPAVAKPPPRTVVTRMPAPVTVGGVQLGIHHLVIAGVVLVCVCVLAFLIGTRYGSDAGLPETEPTPNMAAIRSTDPVPGLVKPVPTKPPPGKAKPPEPGPKTPPKPSAKVPPAEPQYRVRIARLDVSQPEAIDALRVFLANGGIATEIVTRSGYHVLYSRDQFGEKAKSDALAGQINTHLAEFERQTRRPTSKDAYTVQMKKE